MASTITALTILPGNGIQTDAVDGADAADANGWVAKVTLPDDGVSVFDPTRIVLTVSDPGFDSNGNALAIGVGGPVRTVIGTAILRKQWPNQLQRLNSAAAGVRTVYFALSSPVYVGSSVTAAAQAGYYGAAAAGAVANVTNSSTRAYPKPNFAWLNAQHDRATGANIYVEGVAYHRWAMNGRQVACIKYAATDSQAGPGSSPTVTVAVPILSTLCKQGQPPECYAANIALAALFQGDLCRVNAKVYPWLGDASAVLDLSQEGTAAGDWSDPASHTPLRFVCDRTGGYGGAVAYVRPTGTLAGTSTAGVFAAAQAYPVPDASCYPTVAAAAQALETFNGANKGHADVGGATIYLTDDGAGGAVAHSGVATGAARVAGKALLDIRKDPNAVGAVTIALTATTGITTRTRFVGANIAHSALNGFDGANAAGRVIGLEELTIDGAGAATPTVYRTPLAFMRNVTVLNPRSDFFNGFNGSDQTVFGLLLGVIMEPAAGSPIIGRARVVVGGRFKRAGILLGAPKCIVANNKFMLIADSNLRELGQTGCAVIQNVWESARPVNGGALVALAGDGTTVAIDDFLFMHNTLPATDRTGRFNAGYTDVQDTGTGGAAAGVVKRIHFRGNIIGQYDTKSDTFANGSQGGTATNTGRTGNWSIRYHCGDEGNVVYSANQTGDNAPDLDGGSWLGEQWNTSNAIGPVAVAYTDNQAGEGKPGGGTYTLSGAGNRAYDRVAGPATSGIVYNGAAVSYAPLTYDLTGTPRRTDGSGAAGAYERTDNPPISGAGGGTLGNVGESGAGKVAVQGGGSATFDDIGGGGTGGRSPIAGAGGGALGAMTAGGEGEVTDPPITATGPIIAGADRTVILTATPELTNLGAALPVAAWPWSAPFDPSDRVPYAIDFSQLLAADETITEVNRIRMSAAGASIGLAVDSGSGRDPIISDDGRKVQFWLVCDAAFQANTAFVGAGVRIGISVLASTSATPFKQFERTAIVTVRQQ